MSIDKILGLSKNVNSKYQNGGGGLQQGFVYMSDDINVSHHRDK